MAQHVEGTASVLEGRLSTNFLRFLSRGSYYFFLGVMNSKVICPCLGGGGMVYSKKKGWPKQFVLNCGRDPMRKEVCAELQRLAEVDEMSLQEEIWEALLIHTRRRKL